MNQTTSVKTILEMKLMTLNPLYLEIQNESHMHSVPKNSETHFKMTVVSNQFAGKRLVARHQIIYQLVAELMKNPIHALALHTFTPEEWQSSQIVIPDSPDCLGGSKRENRNNHE